jgi:hypothetical protein
MKNSIYILFIISFLLSGCKLNRNNNFYNTTLQEENMIGFFYEKPVIINKNDNKFLQFSNSYIVKTSENYCQYKIDFIKLYNSNNKKSQYTEIKNEDVLLYKLPENFEWLYCYVSDVIHGYLHIYDISKESFYGNFDKNRESGNIYRILLIDEYELLNKYSNVKRYGPLLEIKHNNYIIMFWDSFTGENVSQEYRYQLLDYYEGNNEILLRKYFGEDSEDYIYNIQSANFVYEVARKQ